MLSYLRKIVLSVQLHALFGGFEDEKRHQPKIIIILSIDIKYKNMNLVGTFLYTNRTKKFNKYYSIKQMIIF